MATRMGAPGVRIELHDRSGYSLVETPNAVAAVVGFAPKGELNKSQLLTNTAEQDTYFGLGFNNSRYNQGMYAARAVINAGGHVEFVRPYGEEIDKTSDRKRDLKTDAYVVAFDPMAATNKENLDHKSIKVEYFAATRYKTDGASRYGVTRKINNVGETITNGSNVNFNVDAAEDYTVKTNWVRNGGVARGETDMVMFALMNADPSSANRAYATYKVTLANDKGEGELDVESSTKVGFAVDDIVYGAADGGFKDIYTFRVTNVVEKTVSIKAADGVTVSAVQAGYCPKTLVYGEGDVAVENGYDYLTVKTAVTGRGAKTFGSLFIDTDRFAGIKAAISGTVLEFVGQSGETVYVRLDTKGSFTGTTGEVAGDGKTLVLTPSEPSALDAILLGDRLQLTKTTSSVVFTVTGISDDGKVTLVTEGDAAPVGATTVTVNNFAYNWVDSMDTLTVTVGEETTIEKFVGDLLEAIGGTELGYGKSPVLGDIVSVDANDAHLLNMAAGAASEFIPGDLVAITRGSVDLTDIEAGTVTFDDQGILFVGKVKATDPINSVVSLTDVVSKDAADKIADVNKKFQLLNLAQTNKTAYAAVDTYTEHSTGTETVSANFTAKQWELFEPGTAEVKPKYKLVVEATLEGDGYTGNVTVEGQDYAGTVEGGKVTVTINVIGEGSRDGDQDVPPAVPDSLTPARRKGPSRSLPRRTSPTSTSSATSTPPSR